MRVKHKAEMRKETNVGSDIIKKMNSGIINIVLIQFI